MSRHPVAESRPLGIAGIQLIVSQFARIRAPPRLGGEAAQPARPAAVGGFIAVGMQAGVETGNRTPSADEGGFREAVERGLVRAHLTPQSKDKHQTRLANALCHVNFVLR